MTHLDVLASAFTGTLVAVRASGRRQLQVDRVEAAQRENLEQRIITLEEALAASESRVQAQLCESDASYAKITQELERERQRRENAEARLAKIHQRK